MDGREDNLFARGAVAALVVDETLVAALALTRAATTMPWRDPLRIMREEKTFRADARLLAGGEGKALWAEYYREMERLYRLMLVEAGQL